MTLRTRSRLLGAFYLLSFVPGVFSIMYFPSHFLVEGNAAATAQRIAAGIPTYRLVMLSDLTYHVLFLVVGLGLYNLLREADRAQARLMFALVLASVGVGFVNLSWQAAPLVLLGDGNWLSSFSTQQLQQLAYAALRVRNIGVEVEIAFWGFWLFPLGVLVIKSGWFPKIIGWCLVIAGIGYAVGSFARLGWPDQAAGISGITWQLQQLELVFILWLAIVGAREPRGLAAAT